MNIFKIVLNAICAIILVGLVSINLIPLIYQYLSHEMAIITAMMMVNSIIFLVLGMIRDHLEV